MRQKGRITQWQDDRGFGFVTPAMGGERVFVHIKSFADKSRRPVGNELVTFDLQHDRKGRLQCVDVKYCDERARRAIGQGAGAAALPLATAFLVSVSAAAVAGRVPSVVAAAYLLVSGVTFAVYARDKWAARNKRWRTQEATLHLLSLCGGWPGALAAQRVLRHKSNKRSFRIVFWATVAVNCALLFVLLGSPDALRELDALELR